MNVEKSFLAIALVAVGLILSIVGMANYVGIADWGIPSAVMYGGYAVTVLGLVFVFLDLRENEDSIREYCEGKEIEDAAESVPDDGYLLDLSGQEKKSPFSLFGTEKDEDEATVTDLTEK